MAKALVAVLVLAIAIGASADPEVEHLKRRHDGGEHYKMLTLYQSTAVPAFTVGRNAEAPGSTGVYEYSLACGSATGSLIGTCSETGVYLRNDLGGRQRANWQWTCTITTPCGKAGTGTLSGIGNAPAGDWTGLYPIQLTVTGGTGSYAGVVGGTVTYRADSSQEWFLIYSS